MKIIRILSLALLFSLPVFLFSQSAQYVAARSGLNLREAADPSGKVIASVPYGTKVNILETEDPVSYTAEGIDGSWQKISYNGKTGYVFSGFLLPVPPPTENNLDEYIANHYKKLSGPFAYSSEEESDGHMQIEQSIYDNGVYQLNYSAYRLRSVTYCIPRLSLEQAFLFCRLFPYFRLFLGESEAFPQRDVQSENRALRVEIKEGIYMTGIVVEVKNSSGIAFLRINSTDQGRTEITVGGI